MRFDREIPTPGLIARDIGTVWEWLVSWKCFREVSSCHVPSRSRSVRPCSGSGKKAARLARSPSRWACRCSTVRRLLQRFRLHGTDGLSPDYWHPSVAEAVPSEPVETAMSLRREHPTWGAGLIRVQLLLEAPGRPVPSERTIQRWFVRAGLSPAPAGRPPRTHLDRATAPHETWQMDAKEHIRIKTREEVSWLRLIDECSGAVLWTAVFPPRGLAEGPPRGRAGTAPPGLGSLGIAWPLPGRQRLALGLAGRLPYRAVVVDDRHGYRDALEQPASPPRERGRRAFPRDIRPLVRAVDMPNARGITVPPGANGPHVSRGLPVPEPRSRLEVFPGLVHSGSTLRSGIGAGAVEVVPRCRAPDDHSP